MEAISPFNPFIIRWAILQEFVLVGWHITFFLRVAYGPSTHIFEHEKLLENVLDSLFLMDIVLRFFTGLSYN